VLIIFEKKVFEKQVEKDFAFIKLLCYNIYCATVTIKYMMLLLENLEENWAYPWRASYFDRF